MTTEKELEEPKPAVAEKEEKSEPRPKRVKITPQPLFLVVEKVWDDDYKHRGDDPMTVTIRFTRANKDEAERLRKALKINYALRRYDDEAEEKWREVCRKHNELQSENAVKRIRDAKYELPAAPITPLANAYETLRWMGEGSEYDELCEGEFVPLRYDVVVVEVEDGDDHINEL